jgi:beta-lactamase superfamily II metal-dependent hydrolase
MTIKYIKPDKATLELLVPQGTQKEIELLWGDRVVVLDEVPSNQRLRVRARAQEGWVDVADLGDESLLEVYFIDVGQGDGILIRTPDHKHIMIDGGYERRSLITNRNAADFVDWKFVKDYGQGTIVLDAMISSHCDADHYGGLWDLLNPNPLVRKELDAHAIDVKAFYHAGVGWFTNLRDDRERDRSLGPVESGFLTLLMEDLPQIKSLLEDNHPSGYQLQGEWKKFLKCVTDANIPCQRLSHLTGFVPDFEPDPLQPEKATLKVLAPIEKTLNDQPALKQLSSSSSQNTNGHSITLRLDYGKARILLTGDLNARSQQIILEAYPGHEDEFGCDVAKACHHGSDDCSFHFLEKVNAAATVISSGDGESHDHPRPAVVAASALTGHQTIVNDRVHTPLIYSTEIARSYKLSNPVQIEVVTPSSTHTYRPNDGEVANVYYKKGNEIKSKRLWDTKMVAGVVYGLVNVRTDGDKILCATLNEQDSSWSIKTFQSRF